MPPQAVFFDLDGTLIDSLPDIASAANHALAQMGFPRHDLAAYRLMIGDGADVLMRRALPPEAAGRAPEALAIFKQRYADRMIEKTALYPGIGDLLDELATRGLLLAILSNKPHEPTCRIAEKLLARWSWAAVAGHRPGIPKKPDPAAALQLAGQIGVDPARCVFVGDSANDMITGREAGMTPVGVLWGYRDKEELVSSGARHLAATPAELLGILRES